MINPKTKIEEIKVLTRKRKELPSPTRMDILNGTAKSEERFPKQGYKLF